MKNKEVNKLKIILKQLQSDNIKSIIETRSEDKNTFSARGFVELLEANHIYFIHITLDELIEISKNEFNINIECNLKEFLGYDNLVWTDEELEKANY